MKIKVTRKAIDNCFPRIVGLGYCSGQYLLRYQEPFAYSCGVYGWNCDYYNVGGVCISTGYRNISGIRPGYELISEYEKQAEKIALDWKMPYEEQKQKINALLSEFINKALEA